jgi:undecaprenyl-diphosphatase
MAYIYIMTPYPLYQAVILALVQGFTEFLPVSSSAHLDLFPWLLRWTDPGLCFDIALHVGTLIAIVVYFFKDWLQVLAQGFGFRFGTDPDLRDNPRLLWLMLAATIPVGVSGFLLRDAAETTLRQPYVYGTMLIGVAGLMWLAEAVGRQDRSIRHLGLWDAIFIGMAQMLAPIPGTSRSGITIAAGLSRGYDRSSAARFSFLLSTPAIAGAAVLALHKLHKAGGVPAGMHTAFALGIAVSAVSGLIVIAFLLRYLRHHSMNVFVWYRVALGILVLALAFLRR